MLAFIRLPGRARRDEKLQNQREKSASSMMIGIGTPSSQRRIPLPMMAPLNWSGGENSIVPCAVAQRAAFNRRKACRECSEQHGGGQPEGKLGRTFPSVVGGSLCFGNHIIDALLGVGLAHAGTCSDDLRDICFIGRAEVLIVLETCGPQAQHFCPRLSGIGAARRRQIIAGTWRR